MQPWKTRSRRTVFSNPYLTVETHTVELPDGRVIDDWPWAIMPDYASIVPVTDEGDILCFQQTKYAIAGVSLALIGGYLEPGEDPLAGAQRELLEETGYTAEAWTPLGSYVVDSNRGAGAAHLFLARHARQVSAPQGCDLEEQKLLRLGYDDVQSALERGEFKNISWTAAVALALRRLDAYGGQGGFNRG